MGIEVVWFIESLRGKLQRPPNLAGKIQRKGEPGLLFYESQYGPLGIREKILWPWAKIRAPQGEGRDPGSPDRPSLTHLASDQVIMD